MAATQIESGTWPDNATVNALIAAFCSRNCAVLQLKQLSQFWRRSSDILSQPPWRNMPTWRNSRYSNSALEPKCHKTMREPHFSLHSQGGRRSARMKPARVSESADRPTQGWCIYYIGGIHRRLSVRLWNAPLACPGPDKAGCLYSHRRRCLGPKSQASRRQWHDVRQLPLRSAGHR